MTQHLFDLIIIKISTSCHRLSVHSGVPSHCSIHEAPEKEGRCHHPSSQPHAHQVTGRGVSDPSWKSRGWVIRSPRDTSRLFIHIFHKFHEANMVCAFVLEYGKYVNIPAQYLVERSSRRESNFRNEQTHFENQMNSLVTLVLLFISNKISVHVRRVQKCNEITGSNCTIAQILRR